MPKKTPVHREDEAIEQLHQFIQSQNSNNLFEKVHENHVVVKQKASELFEGTFLDLNQKIAQANAYVKQKEYAKASRLYTEAQALYNSLPRDARKKKDFKRLLNIYGKLSVKQ